MMNFSRLSNTALLTFWENVRRQVIADQAHGRRCRFVGKRRGLYMRKLKRELDRRQLEYPPMEI
jgi:hypothetical protein